jgi:methionine-rich copper-binding protein CopC
MRLPFAMGRAATLVLVASLAVLGTPGLALAHAQLDVATPPAGATVAGTPPEVSGTFTQDMKPASSSLELRDASGKVIATGAVDPGNVRRMVITDLPDLAPGLYEVRWKTVSAEDGELARGTWSFTVTPAPTPSPTAIPTATPTAAVSAAPTSSPSPTPSVAPTPVPSASGTTTGSGGDVLLPIIVAVIVLAAGAGYLLTRRNRPSDPA